MRQKITKRIVDGLTTESGQAVIWDTELKGFGVRCRPSGAARLSVSSTRKIIAIPETRY
jgi:hypothetical protein